MATEKQLRDLFDDGSTEPIFVGDGLYQEIEQFIFDSRPVVEVLPNGDKIVEPHEWEADAVAPMLYGREVYNTSWAKAPTKEERDAGQTDSDPNHVTLADVLGKGVGTADSEGVEVGY